jgi:hypothetical protein
MTNSKPKHDLSLRAVRWQQRYEAARIISLHLGHLPTRNTCSDNALLAWIANQRRSWQLTEDQIRLLESLPGWTWTPQEDRWTERAEELRLFIEGHSRPPRIRAMHVGERSLAHWHSRQRRAHAEGGLSLDRERMFAYVTRGLAEHQ